ncbi:hypothetical protein GUJ93_ZPchr0005g14249 [Zizania palustris]|uniref:Beta-glucosidase n=1 Tax=Zizania palustris TaxID=103762 RepID=A0A8J5SG20_ZIZPA|nr:hypothetical protein GUJ93_ZPchr0005g14249 [Zizania palustris]
MEDANGVVDWDVDIVGPDGGAACKQLVETEDHDATECSSSFGVTLSGSEDDTKPSEISDIEVDSPFFHYPSNGDAAALMDAAVSDNTDRLLKKKRVTDHWRKFISPLMWRCQWRTMKRRKRKRSEEKMNVSSYISNHTVFSYYEKMEAEAHSIDDDENTADDSTPANNDTDSLLGIKRDDATIKQIVLSIQSVQDKVLSLRSSLNKAMAKTSKGATLKVNTHINSAQSSSCSLGKGKASEILERSPRDTSDCDIDEAAVPESALSSYGEDDDMDIFESTMNLLSAEDPHQMGEYHQGSEDVLIDNQAAEEGYQNFELVAPAWRSEAARAAGGLNFTRRDFPSDFVFGAGTSAYQYEGAAAEDGRTPSIWDTFTHAGKMPDKSTGDRAADGYHKYKEDVKLMSDTGLEAYRFSISWSRLIPGGKGPVNPKGLEYYNNLINELVKRGIEIHVTLYHLDFPQDLEDEYHGWLSPRVVEDFTAYADVCFREFGDRVTHWTTLDEPNVLPIAAYDNGLFPPNRCSPPFGTNCTAGNSAVEPYVVAHHSILAHASATQKGVVGINIYSFWEYPFSSSSADIAAAQRALDFSIGWILNPLVYGDYPEIMKKKAGSRIPSFTKEQSELIRGGTDFVGINHYSSAYISDGSNDETTDPRDYNADVATIFRYSRNGAPTGRVFFSCFLSIAAYL